MPSRRKPSGPRFACLRAAVAEVHGLIVGVSALRRPRPLCRKSTSVKTSTAWRPVGGSTNVA